MGGFVSEVYLFNCPRSRDKFWKEIQYCWHDKYSKTSKIHIKPYEQSVSIIYTDFISRQQDGNIRGILLSIEAIDLWIRKGDRGEEEKCVEAFLSENDIVSS